MGIDWKKIKKHYDKVRQIVLKPFRWFGRTFTWKRIGFALIVIISSWIWIPITMYQFGRMIPDNIREYYKTK